MATRCLVDCPLNPKFLKEAGDGIGKLAIVAFPGPANRELAIEDANGPRVDCRGRDTCDMSGGICFGFYRTVTDDFGEVPQKSIPPTVLLNGFGRNIILFACVDELQAETAVIAELNQLWDTSLTHAYWLLAIVRFVSIKEQRDRLCRFSVEFRMNCPVTAED
jgi:hypothetical protein